MDGDAVFAMLCRERDAETGGNKVFPGQRWREPIEGEVWTVGGITTSGGERTALLIDEYGDVLHLPASVLASTCERLPDATR